MADPIANGHSNYIVYVDESGDHSLTSIDPEYPVFVLSFCVFKKDVYVGTVTLSFAVSAMVETTYANNFPLIL